MEKFCLSVVLMFGTVAAHAYDFEVDGIYYDITSQSDKTVAVTFLEEDVETPTYIGEITVPPTVQKDDITYTVKSIGAYAFYNCSQLTKISIPNVVDSIGRAAFASTALTEFYMPASVSSLSINVFYGCNSLERINVSPDNKTYASKDGVVYNKDFTDLVAFPTGIGGDFTVPDGVINIVERSFCSNEKLTSVVLPQSVKTIGEYSFWGCKTLQKIELPDSLITIDSHAFDGCHLLYEINLPESLTALGAYAFGWCYALKSITIPKNITSLNEAVFCYCTSLEEINVPETLTCYGKWAFFGCSALTEYTIPETVTELGYASLAYCTSLKSVYIPNSVTTFDGMLFWNCTSLTDVRLPSNLSSLSYALLADCTAIESLEIPKTVTKICESSLEDCYALKSIDIPEAVTDIDVNAFLNCTSLGKVISRNPVPPTVADANAFEGCNISAVYVPIESASAYKSAPVWRDLNVVGTDLAGIHDAAIDATLSAPKCYDLKGRRLNSDTLTPGLYIIDGRKVILR
jgi:hypothetical protein